MPQPSLVELPREMHDLVERELRPGERVIWARQPTFRLVSAGVLVPVIFAVPWLIFCTIWIGGATFLTRGTGVPGMVGLFPFCGLPFVLVGLGMLTAPVWIRRSMSRAVYVITDTRAIVVHRGLFGGVTSKSFSPERVAQMQRVERRDGFGDLIFEVYTERRGTNAHTVRHGFLNVQDVRGVEDVLRRTLLEGRTRPA
jgi:hypothetical protein